MCAPCDAARATGHDAAQYAGQYAGQSAGFAPRQERAHVQPGGAPSTDEDMMPCPHCARTFFPDRLAKHVLVCGKAAQKKKALEEFIAAEDEHDAAPPPVPKGCESGQLAKCMPIRGPNPGSLVLMFPGYHPCSRAWAASRDIANQKPRTPNPNPAP